MTDKKIVTIKMIGTRRYEIALLEIVENGKYMVIYSKENENYCSDEILDYNMASSLFDIKLAEIDGH